MASSSSMPCAANEVTPLRSRTKGFSAMMHPFASATTMADVHLVDGAGDGQDGGELAALLVKLGAVALDRRISIAEAGIRC